MLLIFMENLSHLFSECVRKRTPDVFVAAKKQQQ